MTTIHEDIRAHINKCISTASAEYHLEVSNREYDYFIKHVAPQNLAPSKRVFQKPLRNLLPFKSKLTSASPQIT